MYRFASLCNLVFPCFSFAEELSDVNVDQEFLGIIDSSVAWELPDSVIREILSKLPVENIITYRVVCKSWYKLVDELSNKTDGDQNSNGLDSSCVGELPDSVIREILSKLPVESISTYRVVCKSWYRLVHELSDKSNGDKSLNGSDSSCVGELPDLLIRDILLNLPVESIRDVCKAWNQFGRELSDVNKEDGDKTSHCSDSSGLSELHNSVIHEILLKLPIDSIGQCRYVCKSWYQLISHPYFVKVYFNNPTLTTSIAFSQHKDFIRCPEDESFGFLEIERKGDVTCKPMNVKALTSPVPWITIAKKSWKTLIGSCDGLLCLVETPYEDCYYVNYIVTDRLRGRNQTVWIVNPLIGEYMELPKVHGVNYDSVVYGFGSTVDGDHYKVLRVARNDGTYVGGAQIITIGVDEKWRDLDISTFPGLLNSHGVTFNGALHWVGFSRCRPVIYAFDIGKETGRCFTFPFEHLPFYSYLVAYDGHLCITDNITEIRVDLWTMKQYGVVESWRRDIILTENKSTAYFYELFPITTLRNGDLLLLRQFDNSLMSFDPNTKKCVELEVSKLDRIRFSMFAYTPSFVSLHGMISGQISI